MYKVVQVASLIVIVFLGLIVYSKAAKSVFLRRVVVCVFALGAFAAVGFGYTLFYFPLPEEAIRFLSAGTIVGMAEGKESCLVLTQGDDMVINDNFLLKTDKGYRILAPFEVQRTHIPLDNQGPLYIGEVKGTADAYASGLFSEPVGSEIKITDSNGSAFKMLVDESGQELGFSVNLLNAYAYIGQAGEEYEIYVRFTPDS